MYRISLERGHERDDDAAGKSRFRGSAGLCPFTIATFAEILNALPMPRSGAIQAAMIESRA